MVSSFRDMLRATAAQRIAEPSPESHDDLCGALEKFLRTSDAPSKRFDPAPGECDGIILRESSELENSVTEFLGFAWLVTCQTMTPLRVRFWPGADGVEFEIRFGIANMRMSHDEADRLWHGDGFPAWAATWTFTFRSDTSVAVDAPIDPLRALANAVVDEATLLNFIDALAADRRTELEIEKTTPSAPYGPGANGWENRTIHEFLESAAAWAADTADAVEHANPWARCARILLMGKYYE